MIEDKHIDPICPKNHVNMIQKVCVKKIDLLSENCEVA